MHHSSNESHAPSVTWPPPPTQGSTVVLVSGGIESAALLSYWCHWDMKERLLPVYIDYGQKNRQEEEHAMLVGGVGGWRWL